MTRMHWPARLMTSEFMWVPGVVGGAYSVVLVADVGNFFRDVQSEHCASISLRRCSRPDVKKYLFTIWSIWCFVGWLALWCTVLSTVGRKDGGITILSVSRSSFGS